MPATSLPALKQHLEARLLELEKLHQTRPSLPSAMARAEAGQRIDDLLDEIAELQRMIDTRPAKTLEDAAVKLRRLGAYVERGQPARLLAGALSAVERASRRSSFHAYGSISRHPPFADDHEGCPVERMREARIFMLHDLHRSAP
jgi:hypothetical protein